MKSREYVKGYFWPVLGRMGVLLLIALGIYICILCLLFGIELSIPPTCPTTIGVPCTALLPQYVVPIFEILILLAIVLVLFFAPVFFIYPYLVYAYLSSFKPNMVFHPSKKKKALYLVPALVFLILPVVLTFLAFTLIAFTPLGHFEGPLPPGPNVVVPPTGQTKLPPVSSYAPTATDTPKEEYPLIANPLLQKIEDSRFPAVGTSSATVTIVEFSDLHEDLAKEFYDKVLPQITAKYIVTGKAKLIYKQFPADNNEPGVRAAIGAECANKQDEFWHYYNLLYQNQSAWSTKSADSLTASLERLADQAGLDKAAFSGCLASTKYDKSINDDVSLAKQAGIFASPTLVINGRIVAGLQPFSLYEAVIDSALKSNSYSYCSNDLPQGELCDGYQIHASGTGAFESSSCYSYEECIDTLIGHQTNYLLYDLRDFQGS